MFSKFELTNNGVQLLNRSMAESKPLKFTKFQIGKGEFSGDKKTLTQLVSKFDEFNVTEKNVLPDNITNIKGFYDNRNVSVASKFTEIGLMAQLGDDSLTEVLFSYANQPTDEAETIPAKESYFSRTFSVMNRTDNVTSITFDLKIRQDKYNFGTLAEMKAADYLDIGDKVTLWGNAALGDSSFKMYIITAQTQEIQLNNLLYAKEYFKIVNDLTTGGADKALSGQMGKELNTKIEKLIPFSTKSDFSVAKKEQWSRVLKLKTINKEQYIANSFLLNITHYRTGTICNLTGILNVSHPDRCDFMLFSNIYASDIKLRFDISDDGTVNINLKDDSIGIVGSGLYNYYVNVQPLSNASGEITYYKSFTDGTNAESNFIKGEEIETVGKYINMSCDELYLRNKKAQVAHFEEPKLLSSYGIDEVKYIQDVGTKFYNKGYFDKVTGKYYRCIVESTDSTQVDENFELASILDDKKFRKIAELSTLGSTFDCTPYNEIYIQSMWGKSICGSGFYFDKEILKQNNGKRFAQWSNQVEFEFDVIDNIIKLTSLGSDNTAILQIYVR